MKRKDVYLIRPRGKDKKDVWSKVGVAFVNRDGSLNVRLDMFPALNLQIRDPFPKKEKPAK